jgi:hypothetical protein
VEIAIAKLKKYKSPGSDQIQAELIQAGGEMLLSEILKSRRMRWAGHVARMGEKRNVYRLLVGKPERKRPLGRPRRRWVDNIRMDLGEVGWGDVDLIDLA